MQRIFREAATRPTGGSYRALIRSAPPRLPPLTIVEWDKIDQAGTKLNHRGTIKAIGENKKYKQPPRRMCASPTQDGVPQISLRASVPRLSFSGAAAASKIPVSPAHDRNGDGVVVESVRK